VEAVIDARAFAQQVADLASAILAEHYLDSWHEFPFPLRDLRTLLRDLRGTTFLPVFFVGRAESVELRFFFEAADRRAEPHACEVFVALTECRAEVLTAFVLSDLDRFGEQFFALQPGDATEWLTSADEACSFRIVRGGGAEDRVEARIVLSPTRVLSFGMAAEHGFADLPVRLSAVRDAAA
jgi:hypothetical protein